MDENIDMRMLAMAIEVNGSFPVEKYVHLLGENPDQANVIISRVQRTAQLKALQSAMERSYFKSYQTLIDAGHLDKWLPDLADLRRLADETTDDKCNPDWWVITINPAPTIAFEIFKKQIEKIVSKVWVTDYCYAFEQRGKVIEDIGTGFHAHIMLKRHSEKKRSDIMKEIRNSAKKVCEVNPHTVNFQYAKTPSDMLKWYNYIKGEKDFTGPKADKQFSCKLDITWREDLELDSIYLSRADLPYLLDPPKITASESLE